MSYFEGSMPASERQANEAAIYYPSRLDPDGEDSATYCPPCVEVGGVQVYVYIRDGILVVSLDYDTADTTPSTPFRPYGEQNAIPTVVTASGETVWHALPDCPATPEEARQLRKSGDHDPVWVLPDWVDW